MPVGSRSVYALHWLASYFFHLAYLPLLLLYCLALLIASSVIARTQPQQWGTPNLLRSPPTGCRRSLRPVFVHPGPTSYAPPPQSRRPLREPAALPPSSDDEGSGSSNVTNRCSAKAVHAVVTKFSDFKKQLVRETGFGGLLHVPCIPKVNLKFSTWLLSRLNPSTRNIEISDRFDLFVHESDVGTVFGIPKGEFDVLGPEAEISHSGVEYLRSILGLSDSTNNSLQALESILEEEIDMSSTRQQVDRFKIAFVVFVMGHLLVPTSKYDHSKIDFWGALKSGDMIEKFNWCRYVLDHILDVARKVRDDLAKKGAVSTLTGCHLFLQVLYLDNVDVRLLNKSHSHLPRIRDFDSSTLNKMILMVADRDGDGYHSFCMLRKNALCFRCHVRVSTYV
ncbi:hypothetical protein EJB05_33418, partial [Eragrostis curvula]